MATTEQRAKLAGSVELLIRRNDDGSIDEVFLMLGRVGLFHLEDMGDGRFWFSVGDDQSYVSFNAKGVTVHEDPLVKESR